MGLLLTGLSVSSMPLSCPMSCLLLGVHTGGVPEQLNYKEHKLCFPQSPLSAQRPQAHKIEDVLNGQETIQAPGLELDTYNLPTPAGPNYAAALLCFVNSTTVLYGSVSQTFDVCVPLI